MDMNTLLSIIRNGENEKVEFKERITRSIHHEISAMTNSQGGTILIGVKDSGEILGTEPKEVLEMVSSSIQSIIPPPVLSFDRCVLDGRTVMILNIEKGENLCSIGGVVHIRIGSSIRPLSIQEILMLSSELGTFEWDGVPFIDSDHIENEYLEHFFSALRSVRGNEIPVESRERYLRSRGALKDGKLTNAGVLIFLGPDEFLPQVTIRLVFMEDGAPVGESRFNGPVWRAIDDAYDATIRETSKTEILVGASSKKIFRFPPRIIREGLINAVAHRNYSVQADIQIIIENGTITIKNPGGLLPGVDLEDPEHVPRNPSLCNLLYDMGYIERYGQGMIMMRREAKKQDGLDLSFNASSNRFELKMLNDMSVRLDRIDKDILSHIGEDTSSSILSDRVGLSIPAILKRLKRMESMDLIKKTGRGPNTRYSRS